MDQKLMIEKILENFKSLELSRMLTSKDVKQGEIIFKEGDKSNEFYFIENGNVGVFKLADADTGKEKELALLGRGDFFGEGVLFDDELRSATVKSLSDGKLWVIKKEDLFKLLEEQPKSALSFLLVILESTSERLQNMNRQMVLLYEIGRIIAKDKKNLQLLCAEVLRKVIESTGCELGVIFMRDLYSEAFSVKAAFDRAFNDLEVDMIKNLGKFIWKLDKELHFLVLDEKLIVAIRDMDGTLIGSLVLKATKNWPVDKQRMILTVAEQLGNVFGEIASYADKSSKEKLERKYIGL